MGNDTIIKVENLYKLFRTKDLRSDKKEALKMLKSGVSKEEVLKKTGVTAAAIDVSFDVSRGDIFTLIGLSGSGKSTVIRCLNMLQPPTDGKVFIENDDITLYNEKQLQELRKTKIAMVFQNFGLMSHKNVLSNVCYGLEIKGVDKKNREKKGLEMLSMVGLEGWESEKISSLSGGMKQRVGIARALANDPDILLMDEAFSALDPLVKNDLQFELMRIQSKMQKTIVFITHDISEAFKIGSKVGILKDGRLIQVATPEDMLAHPADEYVEKFVNNVDPTKVFTIRNVISTPTCIISEHDGANIALKTMRTNQVSSAYVIGDKLEFIGLITLEGALDARSGKKSFSEALIRELPIVKNVDRPLSEIVHIAAEAKFPLVVIDDNDCFGGIITKASVLSSFSN